MVTLFNTKFKLSLESVKILKTIAAKPLFPLNTTPKNLNKIGFLHFTTPWAQ